MARSCPTSPLESRCADTTSAFVGAAINLKADVVVLDNNIGNASAVARFRGWPPQRHQMLQVRAAGSEGPVFQFQPGFSHRKISPDVDQFFVEGVDKLFPGLLRNLGWRSFVGENQTRENEEHRQKPKPDAKYVGGRGPHAAPRADGLIISKFGQTLWRGNRSFEWHDRLLAPGCTTLTVRQPLSPLCTWRPKPPGPGRAASAVRPGSRKRKPAPAPTRLRTAWATQGQGKVAAKDRGCS